MGTGALTRLNSASQAPRKARPRDFLPRRALGKRQPGKSCNPLIFRVFPIAEALPRQ